LYLSANIILIIVSRMTRWVGRVALVGDRRGASRVLVGKPDRKDYVENVGAGV
jgi:hypothetical protein